MFVYFVVFFITLVLQYIIPSYNTSSYKRRIFISLIPLFLFGALRVGEGDYWKYEEAFKLIHLGESSWIIDEHFEEGFVLLCSILPSFRSLVILVSFLMCLGYGTLMYRYVPRKYLWVAFVLIFLTANNSVFFILQSFRNGIAVSLLMLAIPMIKRKIIPLILYFCIGYLASSIHTSAVFAFTIAFLVGILNGPFNKKVLIIWCCVFGTFIISSASGLIEIITPYIEDHFERYNSYLLSFSEALEHDPWLIHLGASIITVPAFIFMKKNELDASQTKLFNLFLIYCLSFFLGVFNTRITQYYCPYMAMAVPIMYERMDKTVLKNAYLGFIVGFISYAMYIWTQSEWFTHAVYHSILE